MLRPVLVALIAGLLFVPQVLADPPPGKGHGKSGGGGDRGGRGGGDSLSITVRIDSGQRTVVHDYYGAVIARGHCPPGLAKKNNGCMPPGQAKKWVRGRPLPRDVVFYDLPRDLVIRLNPPAGTRYVRVAADILLIAVGTGMVLDAIEDLSRL